MLNERWQRGMEAKVRQKRNNSQACNAVVTLKNVTMNKQSDVRWGSHTYCPCLWFKILNSWVFWVIMAGGGNAKLDEPPGVERGTWATAGLKTVCEERISKNGGGTLPSADGWEGPVRNIKGSGLGKYMGNSQVFFSNLYPCLQVQCEWNVGCDLQKLQLSVIVEPKVECDLLQWITGRWLATREQREWPQACRLRWGPYPPR